VAGDEAADPKPPRNPGQRTTGRKEGGDGGSSPVERETPRSGQIWANAARARGRPADGTAKARTAVLQYAPQGTRRSARVGAGGGRRWVGDWRFGRGFWGWVWGKRE
jgi:hypothetical protein